MLDRSTPFVTERWAVTSVIFALFALSVVLRQGWYIVAYALAIYILNLFLAFLQPRFDPSTAADIAESDVEEGAPGLPGSGSSSKGGKSSFNPRIPRANMTRSQRSPQRLWSIQQRRR